MGGGDKCLRQIGDSTILARIVERVYDQVDQLVLSANGDPKRFARFKLPVVSDVVPGFSGPLAGILSGMDWAAEHSPDSSWVVSIPSDTPFLPLDLVTRLREVLVKDNAELACAASAGRAHPVIGLWPVDLREELRRALVNMNIRKIDTFTGCYRLAKAEFSTTPIDPFFNTNKLEDLTEAERLISQV